MAYLNTINTATQNLLADDFLAFTSNNVHGCECSIRHTAGSNTIELRGNGVYLVTVNADVVPTAAGLISIQLLRNNFVIAGAESSVTGVAATTAALSFTTLVKVMRSCPNVIDNTANLQVQITAPASVTNASITVVRVA